MASRPYRTDRAVAAGGKRAPPGGAGDGWHLCPMVSGGRPECGDSAQRDGEENDLLPGRHRAGGPFPVATRSCPCSADFRANPRCDCPEEAEVNRLRAVFLLLA